MLCPVTAVLPTHQRIASTLKTLRVLHECEPRPAEVIVHVDGGAPGLVQAIKDAFPNVRLLTSDRILGPGGGRNRLIASASHELVANFDDDSFPEFPDYFARVMVLAGRFPEVAIFSAASMASERVIEGCHLLAVASGCGCVFRKSWFERTLGFVPLKVGYGMEEVDVSLQLYALGGLVVHDPMLRVLHEHEFTESVSPDEDAAVTMNTALLPFLRYPVWLWPLGVMHVLKRLVLMLGLGKLRGGVLRGLWKMPSYLWTYGKYRKAVPGLVVLRWLRLKREVVCLGKV